MTMAHKVFVPLQGSEVAARLDLATEVWVGVWDEAGELVEERTVVLPQASAEGLCQLLISENAHTLVCGAIEQEYYDYLTWKRVDVVDEVIGELESVRTAIAQGRLAPGAVLLERKVESS